LTQLHCLQNINIIRNNCDRKQTIFWKFLNISDFAPSGTDVMILKIFSPKNLAKKLAFLTKNKAKFWKNLIITLVFGKNANFFAENCPNSQKIVIITSTPGRTGANPTIVNYCDVVKIYSATSSLVRFENNYILFDFLKTHLPTMYIQHYIALWL
jgi:hypothetical protein